MVIATRYDCSFYIPFLELIEVRILWRLWNKLEHVEVLLLAQLDQVSELLRPHDLLVDSLMIYFLAYNQPLLLHKPSLVLLQLEGIFRKN